MMGEEPPHEYMDGCTLFPDRLGKVSHVDVCHRHDWRYWNERTLIGKLKADLEWATSLNSAHRHNTIAWRLAALSLSIAGFAALSTAGLWFWARRHRFDRRTMTYEEMVNQLIELETERDALQEEIDNLAAEISYLDDVQLDRVREPGYD